MSQEREILTMRSHAGNWRTVVVPAVAALSAVVFAPSGHGADGGPAPKAACQSDQSSNGVSLSRSAPSQGAVAPQSTPGSGAVEKRPRAKTTSSRPFPISGGVSRTLQRVTGLTWLSEVVADEAAKVAIEHKLGGKATVRVKAYSFTDLLAGKVKSVKVKTQGAKVNNIPLSEVEVSTANPVWYKLRGHGRGLRTPVIMSVKGRLLQQDVTAALASPKVASQLRGLKLDLPGLGEQQLQIIRPKVQLANGMIVIEALLVTQGASEETGVPVTISGRPQLKGDKIVLEDMKVNSPYIIEPEQFAAFTQELLNPIVDFSHLDRSGHAFRLKNLAILDNAVDGGGQLLLVPKQAISSTPGPM